MYRANRIFLGWKVRYFVSIYDLLTVGRSALIRDRYYTQYELLSNFTDSEIEGQTIYDPLSKGPTMVRGYNKVINLVSYAKTMLSDSAYSLQAVSSPRPLITYLASILSLLISFIG